MEAKLSVWGVRGSLPTADRRLMKYGGNTSCISLEYGNGLLCFDAGSGLSGLIQAYDFLSGFRRLDILISHVHIDHILGLFELCSVRTGEIHLYGEARQGVSFQKQLETVTGRPYWPLGLQDIPAVRIHEIAPGDRLSLPGADCGDIRIFTLRGNHPDNSLLYRAETDSFSITYALDCEMNETMFSRLARFARDSSLLIWDASFTQEDLKKGWGHSTWEEGLNLGCAAGVERILMTHYSREYSDTFLSRQEQLAQRKNDMCIFAREGMVIALC